MTVSGLCAFYIGFMYLRGEYKISKGHLPEEEQKFKNLVLMYVFSLS